MKKTAMMLAALGLIGALGACSSDGSSGDTTGGTGAGSGTGGGASAGGCEADPFACGAGTACWTKDKNAASFECIPSGTKKVGESCKSVVGTAPCGDGMMCLQLQGSGEGTCQPFCDSKHDCPSGENCATVSFSSEPNAPSLRACAPQGTSTSSSSGGDGGSGQGGSSSGQGGSGQGGSI
jgi:hypothetical protein